MKKTSERLNRKKWALKTAHTTQAIKSVKFSLGLSLILIKNKYWSICFYLPDLILVLMQKYLEYC